jgi:hypothetical protein
MDHWLVTYSSPVCKRTVSRYTKPCKSGSADFKTVIDINTGGLYVAIDNTIWKMAKRTFNEISAQSYFVGCKA